MDSPLAEPASLLRLIEQHKANSQTGIYAVCSANRFVLSACMLQALEDGSSLLVETTSSQVNQFGGYTGLTPAGFIADLKEIAGQVRFPMERLLVGGDHTGPHPWATEPAPTAMEKARRLAAENVKAGYMKLHLDASMPLGSEIDLDLETCAIRTADLCRTAEEAANSAGLPGPLYVIGSEVPPPGGSAMASNETVPTSPAAVQETLKATRAAFLERRLERAWERVVAVVVQPGIEFGSESVTRYDPRKTAGLSGYIANQPGIVYEAHSTDYQTPSDLKQMVADHFAILKVGPSLTFAFREAVFALSAMERELDGETHLPEVIEAAMLRDPSHWQSYYHGDERQIAYARRFSLSDRIRYYWTTPEVDTALRALIERFERHPPSLPLISQYAPELLAPILAGQIRNHPAEIISNKIRRVAKQYAFACGLSGREPDSDPSLTASL